MAVALQEAAEAPRDAVLAFVVLGEDVALLPVLVPLVGPKRSLDENVGC